MNEKSDTARPRLCPVRFRPSFQVEKEEVFLIDTLGERLYEGNRRAYVLCFNGEDGAHLSSPSLFTGIFTRGGTSAVGA